MSSTDGAGRVVIVGGGFYGVSIAIYLAERYRIQDIQLIEAEGALLTRASYNNQARVHNGYHYPRSFTTAYRSRVNLPRFVRDWPQVVKQDFTKIYAIARRNSKVTSKQFERFCNEIGASIRPVPAGVKSLFEKTLIEDVFQVDEYAFDSSRLASLAQQELQRLGVKVRFHTTAVSILKAPGGLLDVVARSKDEEVQIRCQHLFNCTYAGINQLGGDFHGTATGLKHEITEMALMALPAQLQDLGITVMDGPFFSLMPFPARGLHTLSHVRYTPHLQWLDEPGVDPRRKLEQYDRQSRVDRMVRDVQRYLPSIAEARYVESLFEVKTVLQKNEGDDGRPILFERHEELPGCYSVLGGKIDNVYDCLEKIDEIFQS